jgi:hypothetical protein
LSLPAEVIVVITPPAPASLGRKGVRVFKAGRIRPALHALGAGRPNPLAASLRLALPSNITGEATGKIIVVEGN